MLIDPEYDYAPGTVHLVDTSGDLNVKKQGTSNVILHPPPSSNPNDPLRWSQKKKVTQFMILFWLAVFFAISSNWTGPIYDTFTKEFNASYFAINVTSALCFLFLGLGAVFLQPTAMKVGRRFVYLLCTVLMIVANIIGARATSVGHLYASNIFSGFAAAPCDSLVEISTTDVFFQHERASFLSWFILSLYFGSDIGPALTGFVADSLGWRWCYWLQVILFGVCLVILVFTIEDTTFRRQSDSEGALQEKILLQINSRTNSVVQTGEELDKEYVSSIVDDSASGSDLDSIDHSIPLRSYWKKIQLWELEYNDERPWFLIFRRPFMLVTFPAVVWCGVVYGAQMMWLSLLSTTQSLIYSAPPYNWSDSTVGLTNFSPLVGSLLGMFYGGKFVDKMTIWLAKRNNGILEPEMRLHAMYLPILANAGGLLAYGLSPASGQPWPVSVIIGQGLLGFAMSSSGSICLTFVVDSYSKLAAESLVLVLFIRNMIGMGFTFAIQPWIDKCGLTLTTWLMFMLSLVINGSCVLMMIFGKTFRKWTADRYLRYSNPYYGEFKKEDFFSIFRK